jgi:Domain of unknown function (DUF4189)
MPDRMDAAAPTPKPSGLRAFVVTTLTLAAFFWPNAGKAEGALAVAIAKEGAKEGFFFGLSASYRSSEEARAKALRMCRQAADGDELGNSCKVIENFSSQCGAFALDPHDDSPGLGWSIAANIQTARSEALSRCREAAGPEAADACVVKDSRCDVVTNHSTNNYSPRARLQTICKYRGWGEMRLCYTIRVP